MKIKLRYLRLLFIMLVILGCNRSKTKKIIIKPGIPENKISKVHIYLENSASMFGYISQPSGFEDVISDIIYKTEFTIDSTQFELNLINGEKPVITPKGTKRDDIGKILNLETFNVGNTTASNINKMFQIALDKARNDNISILVTDCIYDVSSEGDLITAGAQTRSKFDYRLNNDNIQTLLIKLQSEFEGNYYPITRPGIIQIDQERPYYVWIFGKSELINRYFDDTFITSLPGYSNFTRFLKLDDLDVDYQITTKGKIGQFRFWRRAKNKRTIHKIKKPRKISTFQFSVVTDFSELPFSNKDLTKLDNYTCSPNKFEVSKITTDVSGVYTKIKETHLLYLKTDGNPIGNLRITLKTFVPAWIDNTNINNEDNIDDTHTVGFRHLADAIISAYGYNKSNGRCVDLELDIRR